MEKKKPLLNEIIRLLEFLQKNDFDSNNKGAVSILGKYNFKKRVLDLCQKGGYIEGNISQGYQITIEGIQFLEEHKKIKTQQKQVDAQNFLTLGILSLAIFSGIITMLYYYNDLAIRGSTFGKNSIFLTGVILLITILIGIWKLTPKK
jgi:hypothetical protein